MTLEFSEVPEGSKVSIHPKRAGFDIGWFDFGSMELTTPLPTLELGWREGSARAELLSLRLEADVDVLRDAAARSRGSAIFGGSIRLYWGPHESQCVVVVEASVDDVAADRRWFFVKTPSGVDFSRPRIMPR